MRSPTRFSIFSTLSAFAFSGMLGGCDQPVRPANGPTPRQVMVSEALNVPVSTIQAADRGGVQSTGPADSSLDPSNAEAQRLRQTLELLQQAHSARRGATP